MEANSDMHLLNLLVLLWPYLCVGLPTNGGKVSKQEEPVTLSHNEASPLQEEPEAGEVGTRRMSRARIPKSKTLLSVIKQPPDVPTAQHLPKVSFLVPFGRKLIKESLHPQSKSEDDLKVSVSILSDGGQDSTKRDDLKRRDNFKDKKFSNASVIASSSQHFLTSVKFPGAFKDQEGKRSFDGNIQRIRRINKSRGYGIELLGRRDSDLRRGIPKSSIDLVRGRDKVARGRVRIEGALLRQIKTRHEKEEQRPPRKNNQLIAIRPSRLRIRNMNLRRNVTPTIKNISANNFSPVTEKTSNPPIISNVTGYSFSKNKISSSKFNQEVSRSTTPLSTSTDTPISIETTSPVNVFSTTKSSDLNKFKITRFNALDKDIPITELHMPELKRAPREKLLINGTKTKAFESKPISVFQGISTLLKKTNISTIATTARTTTSTTIRTAPSTTTKISTTETTTTTTTKTSTITTTATTTTITTSTTTRTRTTSTVIRPVTTKTISTRQITKITTIGQPETSTTRVSSSTSSKSVTSVTPSPVEVFISPSTFSTLNMKLFTASQFGKNVVSPKPLIAHDEQVDPSLLPLPKSFHAISQLKSTRPKTDLKKDLLEAIRRKISKNKLVQAQKESKINLLNKTEGLKSINLQAFNVTNNEAISSTKSPFFRPITYPIHRVNIGSKRNNSQPTVKLFVNLPFVKPGSRVKIPNVAHIQDKLVRLNAAISEGVKIQRKKQEQAAKDRKMEKQIRKLNHEKVWKLSHPTTKKTTTTKRTTTTLRTSTTRNSETVLTTSFRPKLTTENSNDNNKLINNSIHVKEEKEHLKDKIQFNDTKIAQNSNISTTTESTTTTTKTVFKATKAVPRTTSKSTEKVQILYNNHPSSHFRPKKNHHLYTMPKSTVGKDPVFIVTPKFGIFKPRKMNITEFNASDSDMKIITKVKKDVESHDIEDITGTTVYVVGVIVIIPAVGIIAWLVRCVIQRKEASSSETSSDTGLQRQITEADSLHALGRDSQVLSGSFFETIPEEPENPSKIDDTGTSPWEFSRSRLRLQTVLGEGNFGKVWKAEADDICGYEGTILVAVKTVKENSGQGEVDDLIQEMKIMQQIGPHPNVVTILGVCSKQEPYLLIMEYVMYGKLLTHLREQRSRQSSFFNFSKDSAEIGETLSSKDLTKFAYGVAKGMEFLVTKKVIHRDLAARNILVDHNKNTKISDFGLSRNLGDIGGEMYEQKTKGPLPIRWMAPESLYFSVFTPKSDVWGFGILMWEIVTLGSTPYPGMGAREVMRRVRDGYRLERPAHCHPQLYNLIIQKCWSGDMNKRPDFSELRKELAKLLEDQHGYIDLQNIPENKYYSMEPIPDEEEKL